MKFFEVPNPFEGLSREERLMALRSIGQDAQQRFEALFPGLQEWFRRYDATYLLSFCAVYFLAGPEGVDREATEGRLDFYHHYLEWLQAFALTCDRTYSTEPLSARAEELQASMLEIGQAIQLRGFAVPPTISDAEVAKLRTLAEVRAQTASVRNWAYPDQVVRTVSAVFSQVGPAFAEGCGVQPDALIRALQGAADGCQAKLDAHLRRVSRFMAATNHVDAWAMYCQAFPDLQRERGEGKRIFVKLGKDLERFKGTLLMHSDLRLADIFTFGLEELYALSGGVGDLSRLQAVFDDWSLTFGDLRARNPEHFILDNPVLRQPFVKLDAVTYFCPLLGIVYHLLPGMMEGALRRFGTDTAVQRYQRARSEYLEREVERLFRAAVPHGEVFRGSQWTDPLTGRQYENDILVLMPPFALVVECKSGLVDPPAKRGAEYRLVDTLDDLVVAPSDQANRFIGFLAANPAVHRFQTRAGSLNEVDCRHVRFYVPLSVTYEALGTVSANLRHLHEAGLLKTLPDPVTPSICVTDLEVIVHLLETEPELIHYLTRRSQLERELEYVGDEMDLLAFYLDTGFNLVGTSESGSPVALNLTLKSKELDPYFTARLAGLQAEKPHLDLTTWWRDLLNGLVARRPQAWAEIAYALLNAGKADQVKLETMTRELLARVRHGRTEHRHNWVVLKTGGSRSYAIATFPYRVGDRAERDDLLRHIAAEVAGEHELLGIVCMGVNASTPRYPYDVLAYVPREEIARIRAEELGRRQVAKDELATPLVQEEGE